MQERVGFAAHKLEPKPWATREEWLRRNREMLARVLNLHTVVPFLGSGCSVPLGYPTWAQFTAAAVEHAIRSLGELPATLHVNQDVERLARLQEELGRGQAQKTSQFLFILGVCKKILGLHGPKLHAGYLSFLRELFQPRDRSTDAPNPYHALLGLPVSRFVTTNYDCEIERALAEVRDIPKSELGLTEAPEWAPPSGKVRTFNQKPEHYEHLALFVLAKVKEAENMVFHCHGTYKDPESIIATEEDYQRWYLTDDGGGTAFRQTLNLVLGSNPILFVGFSLGDEDLMRPLRMFSAVSRQRKSARPLFALLPEEDVASERGRQEKQNDYEQLYERYGVHIIPYSVQGSAEPETWGRALSEALLKLEHHRLECRDAWLQKPFIRRVDVAARPPRPYHQYPFASHSSPDLGGDRMLTQLAELTEGAETRRRVIALVGPGGTGKSWYAQRLMNRLLQNNRSGFEGFFFWSSYYSNDALTGLDRALAYLDPDNKIPGNRLERFSRCISEGRYLLVFDGIERFLQEGDNPDEGRAFTAGAASFLTAMASPASKSTVVVTSRLWPKVFDELELGESIKRYGLPRFRTDDLIGVEPFSWWKDNQQEVSALCSLLDGHVYAIVLASEMLRKAGKSGAPEKLTSLRRTLTGTPPDLRLSRMIRESIGAADIEWKGVATKLLERLALFFSTIARPTIAICYQAATASEAEEDIGTVDALVEDLVSRRLVLKLTTKRGEAAPPAYTLHPIVRGYVYQTIHHAYTEALPSFALPGFTAATSALDPGSEEAVAIVTDLFDRLHNEAERKKEEGSSSDARRLCRSAFSVVRSRMELLTAPRWCSYDHYLRFIIRLSHLAKNVSPKVWDYAERHDIRAVEDLEGPLYADDLAWLYNELGLACYAEGAVLDALAVWEQGLEINRVIDSYEDGGSYLFQSQCNLGAAYIHAGHLSVAERYLLDAERTNYRLNDDDHAGRIKGYMALVHHLRGNLPLADDLYQKALDRLKNKNSRAESIFLRHRCDLKIKLRKFDEAGENIESSRALAEAGNYPELVASARMSHGHLFRSQKQFASAQREYNAALEVSRRIGARRLECEVISELARLALDLGEAQLARQRATESLFIANELALGLKQTHDLVVLGRATIEAGQQRLGIAYLKHAKSMAVRQGYWLRGHEAEAELHRFGESNENPPAGLRTD